MDNRTKLKNRWISLSASQKRDLAQRCDSCVPYLSQVAHGHKNPSDRFWRVLLEELAKTPKPRKSKAAA